MKKSDSMYKERGFLKNNRFFQGIISNSNWIDVHLMWAPRIWGYHPRGQVVLQGCGSDYEVDGLCNQLIGEIEQFRKYAKRRVATLQIEQRVSFEQRTRRENNPPSGDKN